MRKIFITFLFIFLFSVSVYADEDIKIITRSERGAEESYRYSDGPEWQALYEKWAAVDKKEPTEVQKNRAAEQKKKKDSINKYLLDNYLGHVRLVETISEENGHKLAWPIGKTNQVKGIIFHHTAGDYESSLDGIRKIYKFHALSRAWGDIGYNFLIGYDGEIFEGRAGGDYAVGAHVLWNNRSTVGVGIIGDYHNKDLNEKQKESIRKLTKYLMKKYGINLTKKFPFHTECVGDSCDFYVDTDYQYPLVGHKDAGNTTCPGEKIYAFLDVLRKENVDYSRQYLTVFKNPPTTIEEKKQKIREDLKDKLKKLKTDQLLDGLASLDKWLDSHKSKKALEIKEIFLDVIREKGYDSDFLSDVSPGSSFDDENKIKIKLSYPDNDTINIRSGRTTFFIKREGNQLIVNGKNKKAIRVKSPDDSFLEITSWNRYHTRDTNRQYNDNKFRGEILLYIKNDRIEVVNNVVLSDYLKGLGEVSNFNDKEKISTIIIAARSYARWYMTEARKFEGEYYDGSDDPNVFQKYLGYGLELRSPEINKIVEETKDVVITYNGKLIKPWYFSQSDGSTLSYYDYCLKNNSVLKCRIESKKYPYLSSVKDPGSVGTKKLGHGVGISGKGGTYFADRGWNSEMIIKYFLRGTELERLSSSSDLVNN